MGYRDFVPGEQLTADIMDVYLMRQTVMTFASAAARDAALVGVLDEGMVAYLEDLDRFTYTGAAWMPVHGRIGCELNQSGQSLATGVTATIAYNSENEDTDGFHSGSGQIVIPAGLTGTYSITTYVTPGANVSATSDILLYVGATVLAAGYIPAGKALGSTSWSGVRVAGDVVTVQVSNGHSGTLSHFARTTCYRVGG
jgi:hypothetical protein